MDKHEMKLDFVSGQFVALCVCGKWRETADATSGKPRDALLEIDDKYAEHVEKAKRSTLS